MEIMSTEYFNLIELFPGLPEELGMEILTRLDYTVHHSASSVCRRWRKILHSKDFYYHRKKLGFTRKKACLIQSSPAQPGSESEKTKPVRYEITLLDPVTKSWDRVEEYPNGLPLFCHVVSSEGKLVALGGWDPVSYNPVTNVYVYDFVTRRWEKRADMPSKRSFFAAAAKEGLVFVAGGHDENKNALDSAWVYDIRTNEWRELGRMSEGRDECQGVVIGSCFWVISGYGTENQGVFKTSAEVYDIGSGEWAKIDDVWGSSVCPRSCVGVAKDGKLFSWGEVGEAVRVGTCVVDLGERVLVSGSGYQGGPQGFYSTETKGDVTRVKLVKIDVPGEFSGFVQSGCSVEI